MTLAVLMPGVEFPRSRPHHRRRAAPSSRRPDQLASSKGFLTLTSGDVDWSELRAKQSEPLGLLAQFKPGDHVAVWANIPSG